MKAYYTTGRIQAVYDVHALAKRWRDRQTDTTHETAYFRGSCIRAQACAFFSPFCIVTYSYNRVHKTLRGFWGIRSRGGVWSLESGARALDERSMLPVRGWSCRSCFAEAVCLKSEEPEVWIFKLCLSRIVDYDQGPARQHGFVTSYARQA